VTSSGRSSVFAGFRFPREVISVAVRWSLRYGLSYRDVEELLAERGVAVDHVTVYRWVQRFTPEFIEAARLCRHAPGDRWFVDETYVKVAGRWTLCVPKTSSRSCDQAIFVGRATDGEPAFGRGTGQGRPARVAVSAARPRTRSVRPVLIVVGLVLAQDQHRSPRGYVRRAAACRDRRGVCCQRRSALSALHARRARRCVLGQGVLPVRPAGRRAG
jgi:transposase, IS6 family